MKIQFESQNDDGNIQEISINVRDNNSMYIRLVNFNEDYQVATSSWYELKPKQLTQIIGSLLHLQSKSRK